MNQTIDRGHLRQVKLNRFDIQLLSLLFKCGGEYPYPDTEDGQTMVELTRQKRLVEIVERYGERRRVRLTDEGRTVVAQLEQMAIQPKVEVNTTGALPPELLGEQKH